MESSNNNCTPEWKEISIADKIGLEGALEDSTRMMILFMNNRYNDAISLLMEKRSSNMIYASLLGFLKFADAILSGENDRIEEGMNHLKFTNEYSSKIRKKHSYTSFLYKFDYNSYTDEEAFAELVHGQTLTLIGLLSFIGDQSIYGIIKAALKIKSSHGTYKECYNILNNKTNWTSDRLKVHFESGTRLGIGGFDLIVSLFPNKLAKLLEYIGFNSDKQVALQELHKSLSLVDGFSYDITAMLLSAFNAFMEYFWGCGEGDMSYFEAQSKVWDKRYKHDSIMGNLGIAHWKFITGKPDEARQLYESCDTNPEWQKIHYMCKWGIAACSVAKCDWKIAMDNMKVLRDECKMSPAMFTYLYAVLLFMHMNENTELESEKRKIMLKEISDNLEKIPKLKRTVGGRKVFHEKIVIERSKRYVYCPDQMLLPILELCYIWNIFAMMYGNKELINTFLDRINAKYDVHKNDIEDSSRTNLDEYAFLTFMRGVCFKHLGMLDESIHSFNEVLSCGKKVSEEENHLLPQSCYELGLIERSMGKYNESKEWFKRARDGYKNYLTDVMIQYRAQIMLNELSKKIP